MSVQSHSHSHPFLNDLSLPQIEHELSLSRARIEEITGRQVTACSCPGGRYNRAVLTAARRQGYRAVCTSRPRPNVRKAGRDPVLVDRFLIGSATAPETFRGIVELRPAVLRSLALRSFATGLPKRLLGNRLYHRLWRRFH